MPALESEFGADNFEVHFVGKNEGLPQRFDKFRNHPALIWRGPVFPADPEFLSCDILLVPIPAKTGPRVRIINGFSFGCCVVAHTANQLGVPELVHGDNTLMAASGREIARLVRQAATDEALNRLLGEAGRKVYEDYYTEEQVIKQYLPLIQQAISDYGRK